MANDEHWLIPPSVFWRSTANWNSAIWISAVTVAMRQLYIVHVKFGELKCSNPRDYRCLLVYLCMATGQKSAYQSSFIALAFPNASDDRNVDRRIKMAMICVLWCNFGAELPVLNCVHQALIGTRVSSSTFAREHGCVSLLLARRRHCHV